MGDPATHVDPVSWTAAEGATVEITTFGYLHGPAPVAHITLDLRKHFRDPHVKPELRNMTALDSPVQAAVLGTPGIGALIAATAQAVKAYQAGPTAGVVTVAVGCAGGRHRAATVGMALSKALSGHGIPNTLIHRDLAKPVVAR